MRLPFLILTTALLCAVPAPLAAQSAPKPPRPATGPALPEWLAGNWSMEDGALWAEEIWTSARGGIMLGIARQGFGANLESWEMLRIAVKGGALVLTLQPSGGGTAIDYPAVLTSAESIEFANPSAREHQRIRLWRAGQLLMSETSRIDGSDPARLNFRPVATGE
ncbi:hypothetical protein H7F51_05645 [Novosphingobium flavum]|uniref:DUF6265 domain-containing protein n=1 Tax=Novosphingobium flavum TaxID=1778672 RepID=A0A7X1KKW8_9SPHN|nr:DUF6265 family protein [Novosphingobium flavum]MBC2664991.1 hypothetical protein [Novosphingobium flavum]